ncbi:MAG TPA: hypothetical protein VMZ28_05040 [Kofleriaceae bacterium]|nr:hypothetical protein [Kofleriaceae bacterium]
MRTPAAVAAVLVLLAAAGTVRAQPAGAEPVAADEKALAREVFGVVQERLAQEEAELAAHRGAGGQPDARHHFAGVYGQVLTRALGDALDGSDVEQPLELAISALAFLPLFTVVNDTIARELPRLRPGQKLSRADARVLRRAGVPRHWVALLRLTQDPKVSSTTAQTLGGIAAHILGDLKEVVRADLHAIGGDPATLDAWVREAIPEPEHAAIRARVARHIAAGNDWKSEPAFRADYDGINQLISRRTQDSFAAIGDGGAAEGHPDVVAEVGWRFMRGVGPVRGGRVVRLISLVLFRTWRDRAFRQGAALAKLDRARPGALTRARIRTRTAMAERGSSARIAFFHGLARAAENRLLKPVLDTTARGLRAWRGRTQKKLQSAHARANRPPAPARR